MTHQFVADIAQIFRHGIKTIYFFCAEQKMLKSAAVTSYFETPELRDRQNIFYSGESPVRLMIESEIALI